MGYDMYLVSSEGDDNRDYCRRNVWGMDLTRCLMDAFGMGDWSIRPPYRECCDLGDEEEYDELYELVEARLNGEHPAQGGREAIRALPLAMYKLCSNDGWLVTPEECAAAVAAYEGVSEEDKQRVFNAFADEHTTATELREWFEEWVDFLRRAARSRGFRVW